jgi:hypothetical protein
LSGAGVVAGEGEGVAGEALTVTGEGVALTGTDGLALRVTLLPLALEA